MRPSRRLLAAFALGVGLPWPSYLAGAQGATATCLAEGKQFSVGPDARTVRVGDQRVRFCSTPCLKAFAAAPEKFLHDTVRCPVYTDRRLKPDAKTRRIVNNGIYYLCCAFCIDDFSRTPLRYLKELDDPVTGASFAPRPESPLVQIDDQVYVFQNDRTRETFEKDRERFVVRYR